MRGAEQKIFLLSRKFVLKINAIVALEFLAEKLSPCWKGERGCFKQTKRVAERLVSEVEP